MKKLSFILILFGFITYSSYAQFTFGVSPSWGGVGGVTFGYQFNNFVPYIGVQYLGASASIEATGYEYQGTNKVKVVNSGDASFNLLLPQIGAKAFIINEKDIKGYVNANINYGLIFGDASVSDTNANSSTKEYKDALDGLSIFGFEVGFGTEYYFSPRFSISGEFGIRLYFLSSETSFDQEIYNPITQDYETARFSNNIDLNLSLTYAKIGVNYYFGR